jgi:hypothetical protein
MSGNLATKQRSTTWEKMKSQMNRILRLSKLWALPLTAILVTSCGLIIPAMPTGPHLDVLIDTPPISGSMRPLVVAALVAELGTNARESISSPGWYSNRKVSVLVGSNGLMVEARDENTACDFAVNLTRTLNSRGLGPASFRGGAPTGMRRTGWMDELLTGREYR